MKIKMLKIAEWKVAYHLSQTVEILLSHGSASIAL